MTEEYRLFGYVLLALCGGGTLIIGLCALAMSMASSRTHQHDKYWRDEK